MHVPIIISLNNHGLYDGRDVPIFTSPPLGLPSIAISVSVCRYVCLSVCSHTSKITCPNFTKFSVHVYTFTLAVALC